MYKRRRKSSKMASAETAAALEATSPTTQDLAGASSDLADATATPMDVSTPSQVKPPFLRIPLEIREHIYALCLVGRDTQPILWPAPHSTHGFTPSLLTVCRQIWVEAAWILYTRNRFTFLHPSDCSVFTHIMDANHSHRLTSLVFRLRDRDADVALWRDYFDSRTPERGLLYDLPKLSNILVVLGQGWPHVLAPLEAFRKWQTNKALREVCRSLGMAVHNGVDVTVVSQVRCHEQLFEHLRQEFVEGGTGLLVESPAGRLRSTHVLEINGVKALLEVQNASAPSMGRRTSERVLGAQAQAG